MADVAPTLPVASILDEPPKRAREDERLCAYCHEGEDSDDPDDDPVIEAAIVRGKPVLAHEMCLNWCPDLWQAEDLSWQNVGKSLSRCHRLKCAVCGEGDAPLGCKRAACKKNWHYPCAMEPSTGLVVYEEESCVACPVCHEVLQARERKKNRIAAEKAAARNAKKVLAKPAAAVGKATGKAAGKTAGKTASSEALSWSEAVGSSSTKPRAKGAATSAGGKKSRSEPKAKGAALKPIPDSSVQWGVAFPSAPEEDEEEPEESEEEPPPPARELSPEELAAQARVAAQRQAIGNLFVRLRTDEIKVDTVAKELNASAETQLSAEELATLLADMEQDNLVMARIGIVFQI